MKKLIFTLLATIFCSSIWAQQTIKGDNVSSFSSISLSGKLFVEMIHATKNSIEIELVDIPLSRVKWGVVNDELSVSLAPSLNSKGTAHVKIFYTKVSDISISGSELVVRDILSSPLISLSLSSGAKITVDCECDDIAITALNNSVAKIGGITEYMTLRATELSTVQASSLMSVSTDVECTTGAEAYVAASKRLVAISKTGSSVYYKGSPSIMRTSMTKNTIGLGGSINNIGK